MTSDETSDQGKSGTAAQQPTRFLRLYYFTNLKFGISNVLHQRIKIARILELNDLFEMRCVLPPKRPDFLKNQDHWLKNLNDKRGIICFSKTFTKPLMWGHYAEKSTGMVLAFDVDEKNLFCVKYRSKFLKTPNFPVSKKFAENLVASKAMVWRHEKERRMFVDLKKAQVEKQAKTGELLFFEKFSPSLVLRKILLGPECSADGATVNALKRRAGGPVEIYMTKRAVNRFAIEQGKRL